jgi:hypothetical protein
MKVPIAIGRVPNSAAKDHQDRTEAGHCCADNRRFRIGTFIAFPRKLKSIIMMLFFASARPA